MLNPILKGKKKREKNIISLLSAKFFYNVLSVNLAISFDLNSVAADN